MKMKLGHLVNTGNELDALLEETFKSAFQFKLLRVARLAIPEIKDYFKAIQPIIEKYDGKAQEGDRVTFEKENAVAANKDILDLQNQEIKLDFEKIKLSDIESNLASDSPKIKIKQLLALDWLIDLEA